MKHFIIIASILLATGCAHSIHQVHVSGFKKLQEAAKADKISEVEVLSEQYAFMGFRFNIDYVDDAYKKLLASCPSGNVSGISTQSSTSGHFMSWTNKILIKGSCIN